VVPELSDNHHEEQHGGDSIEVPYETIQALLEESNIFSWATPENSHQYDQLFTQNSIPDLDFDDYSQFQYDQSPQSEGDTSNETNSQAREKSETDTTSVASRCLVDFPEHILDVLECYSANPTIRRMVYPYTCDSKKLDLSINSELCILRIFLSPSGTAVNIYSHLDEKFSYEKWVDLFSR
jgi:hypothetical protein